VLDLGCGTGQIAIPLARRGIPVRAVDPDSDMLAEGLRVEADAGSFGVAWQRGYDEVLRELKLPPLALCTMGASFHWTAREGLLHTLNDLIQPGGAIAVLDGGLRNWTVDWDQIAKEVVQEFLGNGRRVNAGTYMHSNDAHAVVLARSAFSAIERQQFTVSKALGVDEVIGLQLSTSYASPAQLGKRIEEFKNRLRRELERASPQGRFTGTIEYELLIGFRP
jgi:SAM-dependent methyltransferase